MAKKVKGSAGAGKKAEVKKTSNAKSVKAKPKAQATPVKKVQAKPPVKAASKVKHTAKSAPKAKSVQSASGAGRVPARRVLDEGIMMAREGKVTQALDLLLGLEESNPEMKELYPLLCELYVRAGRADIPSVWVSNAVSYEPHLETEFIDIATELYDSGMLNEAASILGGLVDADSKNVKVWNNYSIVLYTLASYLMEESERCIVKGLSLGGDNQESIENAVKISEIRKAMSAMLPVQD